MPNTTKPTTTTKPATRNRFDAATQGLDVHAILRDGEVIGRIVTRIRATASGHTARSFVHIFGQPIIEGAASGGGYNLRSAAVQSAIHEALDVWPESIRLLFTPIVQELESRSVDSCTDPDSTVGFVRVV